MLHATHTQSEQSWGVPGEVTSCETHRVGSLLALVPALGWEEEIGGGKSAASTSRSLQHSVKQE